MPDREEKYKPEYTQYCFGFARERVAKHNEGFKHVADLPASENLPWRLMLWRLPPELFMSAGLPVKQAVQCRAVDVGLIVQRPVLQVQHHIDVVKRIEHLFELPVTGCRRQVRHAFLV